MRRILILSIVIVISQSYAAGPPSKSVKGKRVYETTVLIKHDVGSMIGQKFPNTKRIEKQSGTSAFRSQTSELSGSLKVLEPEKLSSGVNLTPYTPSGWGSPLVVTAVAGDTTDSGAIYPTNDVYISWAAQNTGTDPISGTFYVQLYVDGILAYSWSHSTTLPSGWYTYVKGYDLGTLDAGLHTFKIWVDATNTIAETNESDNTYQRQYTISAGAPPPPTNLQATAVSSGQIDLTWTASTGSPTYYRILRSTFPSSGFVSVDTLKDPSATGYFSALLDPNTTYYYEVIAGNGAGESVPTSAVSATTLSYSLSWQVQNSDTISWWAIKAVDTSTVWAVGYSAQTSGAGVAYVARTTDGGTTWNNCSGNLGSKNAALCCIEATNASQAWVGDEFGNIYYTSNGGASWTTQSSGTANFIDGIRYISSNTLVAVADPLYQGATFLILTTSNNGTTWNVVQGTPSSRSDLQEVCTVNVLCSIGTTVYAGTQYVGQQGGRMIKSTDGGASWQVQSTQFASTPSSIAFRSASVGLVMGGDGSVAYSSDGGASWNSVNRFVPDYIGASQWIPGTLTYWAGGQDGVFRSTDDGITWSIESVPFKDPVDGLAFPNQNLGWVVSSRGLIAKYVAGSGTPIVPALASPADGSTGMSVNPTLSWNASAGAATYELQVSTDSNFTAVTVDRQNLTTASQSISGLANGTKYFWRVNASNAKGTSGWSAVWRFTTAGTVTVPLAPTILSPTSGSTDIGSSATLSWNSSTGALSYELQVSTDSTFGTLFYDKSGVVQTSQIVTGFAKGTVYRWRVNATNSAGTSGWSASARFTTFTYPSSVPVSVQYTPPAEIDSSNYRMIGLPGDVDIPLAKLFSGEQGKSWNAYWDNGDDQNYLVEYDGSGRFDFLPGVAFWILSKDSFSVSQDLSTVSLDTRDCFSITVHSGWNLISDPFDKSISWSTIQSLNGVTQPLYSFNGNYSMAGSLDPYIGYYFYDDQNLSQLKIPYTTSSTSQYYKGRPPDEVKSNPNVIAVLTLSTKSEKAQPVTVGLASAASDNVNSPNIFAPPDNFDEFRIQIVDQNVQGSWKKLFSDFKATERGGESFEVEIKNLTGRVSVLKPLLGDGLGSLQPILVDIGTNTIYDLRTTDSISISGQYKHKSYNLVVGDGNYIDSMRAVYAIKSFQLFQNYPNPFNPTTTIQFDLKEASNVRLEIYDILGQRVIEREYGTMNAGRYEEVVDMSRYASGIYFYRIDVVGKSGKRFSSIRKLVLLK